MLKYFISIDIRDSSDVVQDIVRYYTCEMALRNMNALMLGPTESSDTTFTYIRNDLLQTSHSTLVKIITSLLSFACLQYCIDNIIQIHFRNTLNQSIGDRIKEELLSRYKNLNDTSNWAVLIGYDGSRKNTYISRNINEYLPSMFKQIDRMPMRRREMQQQLQSGISCSPPLASSASSL